MRTRIGRRTIWTALAATAALALGPWDDGAAHDGPIGFGPQIGFQSANPAPRPMGGMSHTEYVGYLRAIDRTAAMVRNQEAQRLARQHGLQILNVTWEDTARFKNSAVGPNISDMTIQVFAEDPEGRNPGRAVAMPVVRFPNFSDLTADVDPQAFTLLVGNHNGRALRRISLWEFLRDPRPHLSFPGQWAGDKPKTLLAPRDQKVLVSAQACFLPVPARTKATFNPVIFNYQSSERNPAVLTILATREGTSVTVIDNKRDAFATGGVWGQRLFHNANGMRASLTGQRLTEFRQDVAEGKRPAGEVPESALNMVLLIQVPLKHRELPRRGIGGFEGGLLGPGSASVPGAIKMRPEASDVEAAVIGHGDLEGPFTELDNLPVERDERFPVRVTVQFYKATSNGIVSPGDFAAIKRDIDRIYAQGSAAGSLVTQGETGRVTEYVGARVQPPGWWEEFWERYEANMGISREEAIRRLRELLGEGFQRRPVTDLYLHDLLRR
jgi:hypothetical protein